MTSLAPFVARLPKAELHLHLEGTLEPELLFRLAERHGMALPYATVDDLRVAYSFGDLQEFLDLYYQGMDVLRDADDFFALTVAYLARAAADGVVHAEMFFDPQPHLRRGVALEAVLDGIGRACALSPVSTRLIPCFLRDLPVEDAEATLDLLLPHAPRFVAVGLDSAEVGHPPRDFVRVFARAREAGLATVAHAGEEGPPEYVWEALDLLEVVRIDHGVRAIEDDDLVERLARDRVPLTVCPLSNLRLGGVERLEEHPLGRLQARGVQVTINSDDPAYFGGYVAANYLAVDAALGLGPARLAAAARASIEASFLPESTKRSLRGRLAAVHV